MDHPSEPTLAFPDLPRRCATPRWIRIEPATVIAGLDPDRPVRSNVLRHAKVHSIARSLYTKVVQVVLGSEGRTAGMTRRVNREEAPEKVRLRTMVREEKRIAKALASPRARQDMVDECVDRIARPSDREAFREVLSALVENNAIPAALLTTVPQPASKAGKTRFDQLYDACMFLAFPEYRPIVVNKAFGPNIRREMRLWRALFPKEFGLSHVILRATSFQEAFALACDYACRLSLKQRNHIPTDLSIRIQFMSDRVAGRMLDIRRAMKDRTRIASNLKGRKYSPKDVHGARLVAIGRHDGKNYSIFKYAERKDLDRILELKAEMRTSAVDIETFRPKEVPPVYDEP